MDVQDLSALLPLIGNLGFPAAVCIYLLLRFEKKINDLDANVRELLKNWKKQ